MKIPPKKNTQQRIAARLGVTQKTVSVWFGTNIPKYNTSPYDARVKIPPKQRPKLAAKKFLDAELAKYETWDHADKNIRVMFASNSQFQQNKRDGVGRDTILKFLGGFRLPSLAAGAGRG